MNRSLGAIILLAGLAVLVAEAANPVSTQDQPTIAKDTLHVTLRTHNQYYRNGQRDESTWSWTPRIKYRVNGPLAGGSQLSVEFTLPGNKPWVKFDCETGEIEKGRWWETECGNDLPDEKAIVETG